MELQNGDLFGIPGGSWYSKLAMRIVGAKTFHWGMIIGKDKDGYITSESLGKGTSIARFDYDKTYIYRIKNIIEPNTMTLISNHSWHGNQPYDMEVNFLTTIWFILKHYFKKAIPVIKNHTFNCQEWICYMADCLGYQIIPPDEYPYCVNLEKSPMLEYIGEIAPDALQSKIR